MKSVKLCTVNLSEESVDRIVRVMRTAGIAIQAQQHGADGDTKLSETLNHYKPDIVMVGAEGDIDIGQASATFRKKTPNVPRILVASVNNENRSLALQFQYDDLIEVTNEPWLIHVISREHKKYLLQCSQDSLQLELENINQTHQQMVAATDKGIAFISDGIHITCTQRYAEMFGFAGESDVAITTLIDLIAPAGQEAFKTTIKDFEKGPESSTSIETTAISTAGKPIPVKLEFTKSVYENEPALQVTATNKTVDKATGKTEGPDTLIKQISYYLKEAKQHNKSGCIVCIQPWNFWKTRHKVGIIPSTQVLTDLYDYLCRAVSKDITVARIGSDFFAILLPGASPKKALAFSEKLALAVEEHIFEVENLSVNCFCRAGIVEYDKRTKESPSELIDHAFDVVATFAEGDAKDKARIYVPPKDEKKGFDPSQTLSSLTQDGGFKISYQPVLCLREDAHELYEVIPSIMAAEGETVPTFFELAALKVGKNNESKFDRWVLTLLLNRLTKQVKRAPNTRLLVQLSPEAFADKTLLPWLAEQCKKLKLSRNHFILQWQEPHVTERLKAAGAFFALMKKARMQYCFTHYTPSLDSEKTLATLKPKLLKIDDEVAAAAHDNQKSAATLKEILEEAAGHDSSVIIPGVDNPATLASLWQSGASFVQGEYIQAPSPNMEFDFSEMAF